MVWWCWWCWIANANATQTPPITAQFTHMCNTDSLRSLERSREISFGLQTFFHISYVWSGLVSSVCRFYHISCMSGWWCGKNLPTNWDVRHPLSVHHNLHNAHSSRVHVQLCITTYTMHMNYIRPACFSYSVIGSFSERKFHLAEK